jgi:PKD repeat protein
MKKILLLLWSFWLTATGAYAQQHPDHEREEIQKCYTMESDSLLRKKYPQLGSLLDFERDLQLNISKVEEKQKRLRTTAEVITIPIIVHVIHNGEAVGTGLNISAAQVQSQLDALNEDFRRKPGTPGFNTNPVGADIELEFCLAQVDPQGQTMAEPGIHRYNGRKTSWTRDEIENNLKPVTFWDPDKYYNVWVVADMKSDATTLLGYAQFPSRSNLEGLNPVGGPAATDGVVVWYRSFGRGSNFNLISTNNQGRTMTHETGHWLGLRHIWGDGGCTADDFVSDTPVSDGPSRGCQVGRVSCGNVNMVQNYMDYSDDACFNIFTNGQKARMRTVMEVSPRRSTLRTSNVCGNLVAGRPVANFTADRQLVLRGGVVNFNDLSLNFPTSWRWTFEGGEPATSTDRNPTVIYNTPGTYDVTLIVANAQGSDTLVRRDYIEVSTQGICSNASNFNGTPTVLRFPPDSTTKGYVSGHNSSRIRAVSEQFANTLGYTNLGGASLRFGYVSATKEDATVTVVVWNARGFQGGPGAVLERKEVLLSRIQQDIANGEATNVTFDRNIPLFSRGFHIGIELNYTGDTVALVTTRNGESVFNTSWQQDSTGRWESFSVRRGYNFAHDITANIGMQPSVQVTASSLIINPGETVTLNARGASLFSWQATGGSISTTLGPQVIASPLETTTYTVTGGGLDLCRTTASVTVLVRGTVSTTPEAENRQLQVYPNPSAGKCLLTVNNDKTGAVTIEVFNMIGNQVLSLRDVKNATDFEKELDLSHLSKGVYIVAFTLNKQTIWKKIVKL